MSKRLFGTEAIKELGSYVASLHKLTDEEREKIVDLANQARSVKNADGVVTTLVNG